jgi:hypothetical protein
MPELSMTKDGRAERQSMGQDGRARQTAMSDTWVRRAVMLAMMLLVLHAVGAWCYSVLGMAGAIASTLLVVAVSLLADHMARAGRGSIAWFVVPTLAFTALPLAARLWTVVQAEQGWWQRTVALAPFVIGFAAPVLILLAVHLHLTSRAPRLS